MNTTTRFSKDVFIDLFDNCNATDGRSIKQIYEALWRRRVQLGITSKSIIVSELRLTNRDYDWLCRWTREFPVTYYEKILISPANIKFGHHGVPVAAQRAIGLILTVMFAEHLRRVGLAENSSAWPLLQSLFSDRTQQKLFSKDQPRDELRNAIEDGVSRLEYGLLHRFDEKGTQRTQRWFSTLRAQYGLSSPDIADIRSLLVDREHSALQFLLERSERFVAFWHKLKEIRAGMLSMPDARKYLEESPYIPIGHVEKLLSSLRGRRTHADGTATDAGGGIAIGATQDASGLVAQWRLVWAGDAPVMRIGLDIERIAAALPGDDDVLVTMNGRFWSKLLRDGDQLSGAAERTLNAGEIKPTLSFRFESDGAAREDSVTLVPDDADVAFFDAASGKPAPDISALDPKRAWICLCRRDLKLSCDSSMRLLAENWAVHFIEAGGIIGATLRDANGFEVWSHVMPNVSRAIRPAAPPIKVEPVNVGAYLAVNSRVKLRLRVVGEGELRAVRIAGTPYSVTNTSGGAFVDDVLLGADLCSREVPFRYVVQHDDQSLIGEQKVNLPIVGAFTKRDGAWLPLFKRDIFAAENADDQSFRFLHTFDSSGVLYNGHRFLQNCADDPARLITRLDGLGEDFTLRPQAFNQGEARVTIAYTCVRSGLIAWAEMREDGAHIELKLRRPNDLIGYDLVLWSARSGLRVVSSADSLVSHDEGVSQTFEVFLPDDFGAPDVLALSFRGELQGSWCFSGNEVWQLPPNVDVETARRLMAFFRWCRLPFNWSAFSGFFGTLLRSDPLMLDALFTTELPVGLRLTKTIHGDDVLLRSLRLFVDRSLPEFREWISVPSVAHAWMHRYRHLAHVHPVLARTVFHVVAGRWPTAQPDWQKFELDVAPALQARFGDELDKRYLENVIEKWLTIPEASSAEMHALLCEEMFEQWFWRGWLQT